MRDLPLKKICRWMEPGPIVLVSTARKGKANLMTMGFHMMIQHEPPLLGVIIGPWDHSFKALKKTKECVIAIPGADLAEKVVDIGNCSGDEVDKFTRFRLTPMPAEKVEPPLVKECLANLECNVVDTKLVKKYGLFILEVVRAWENPRRKEQRTLHHIGDGKFKVSGRTLDHSDRMVKFERLLD